MKFHKTLGFAIAALTAVTLMACGGKKEDAKPAAAAPAAAGAKEVKVGFVYVGPVGDGGWTFAHDNGRKAMIENLAKEGIKVTTQQVESVPEGADAERVIRDLVAKGNQIIFTTSFGYMDSTLKVAQTTPKVTFYHATGYKNAANMGTYEARTYEGAYLAGVTAGKMSKTGVLGFVASVQIPEVIRNINAFTLGARSVNPAIKTKVVFTGSWFDMNKERAAAETLIGQGADVLMQNTDSSAVLKTAEEKGKMAFGWDSDMSAYGPKAHLASSVIQWGDFYTQAVKSVLDGKFSNAEQWKGVADGWVDLVNLNPAIPADAKSLIQAKKAELAKGGKVFVGPIKDQAGVEKVAKGVALSDAELSKLDWLVEGVEGKLK
ncbi:BMP family ABC transporter substrate-binding protein [Hydromonas duriensis]|uniref:Nucleoside-binding protein n=1 Tax=Hydromonas duriensis TaxID=1527608 RepID=A0A4R6Y7R0_9BURK|nr:BMP family ABC transporter substrate-binding protein [Hydromonas duriensis]TDR31383.1 nucleoside-binding protein [Hydromonas duriensis]